MEKVSRKKLLKFWRPFKPTSGEIQFLFQNLVLCIIIFSRYFKALPLVYHMANNLIVAISFDLKLNSNLKQFK